MPVLIGGDNLPSPVRLGLTDLQNIGGASGPPGPPGSGTTESRPIYSSSERSEHFLVTECFFNLLLEDSRA